VITVILLISGGMDVTGDEIADILNGAYGSSSTSSAGAYSLLNDVVDLFT
jgi:hypothetical protein